MALHLIDERQAPPTAFPLFDSILDRTGRRQLQRLATLVTVARGQIVIEEGDGGRDLLVLAEGFVKLWKALPNERRQIVAFRSPGDPISLHRRHTPWPVTAQAVTACNLLRIEWESLRCLTDRYPAIDRALLDLAGDEISSQQDRILTLGRKTAEERLASFILDFCRPFAAASSPAREIYLPVRRPEIAEYLGLTTESVCRDFSRFKRQRIIAMPRPSRIIVLNRPALEAMALGVPGSEARTGRLMPVPPAPLVASK